MKVKGSDVGVMLNVERLTGAGLQTLGGYYPLQILNIIFASAEVDVAGQVTGQVKRLLSILRTDALSSREIMVCLYLKGRDNFLKAYLNPAMEWGFVEQMYPNSPRHKNQKYRLTDKGLSILKQLTK